MMTPLLCEPRHPPTGWSCTLSTAVLTRVIHYAPQPLACCTYRRLRAAHYCTYAVHLPASGVPYTYRALWHLRSTARRTECPYCSCKATVTTAARGGWRPCARTSAAAQGPGPRACRSRWFPRRAVVRLRGLRGALWLGTPRQSQGQPDSARRTETQTDEQRAQLGS